MLKFLGIFLLCTESIFGLNAFCQAPATYKIGAVLHLTGEFARQGIAFQEGIDLAVNEINASGGIGGKELEAIYEDTQYKPLNALTSARKLTAQGEILAVMVSTATEMKSAAPIFQRAAIPAIVLWDASPEIENFGDYIFGIGPWAPSSGQMSSQFAINNLKAKKAVTLCSNTEWSQYVCKYFISNFEQSGGKILHSFELNPDEVDFRTIIARAKKFEADVWYVPVDGNIVTFFQQVKQAQVGVPLITSDSITEEYFLEAAEAFEGIYQSMTGDPSFPPTQKMISAYQQYFKRPISQTSFISWGYDATKLVAKAIGEVGSDKVKIRDYLAHAKNFEGASGPINMSPRRSAPRPIKMYMVKHSKFLAVAG